MKNTVTYTLFGSLFVLGKVRVSDHLFFKLNVDVDMILTLFFFSNKIQALIGIGKKGDLRLRECLRGSGHCGWKQRAGRHWTLLLYLPIFSRDGLGKRVQEIIYSRVMYRLIVMIQHLQQPKKQSLSL